MVYMKCICLLLSNGGLQSEKKQSILTLRTLMEWPLDHLFPMSFNLPVELEKPLRFLLKVILSCYAQFTLDKQSIQSYTRLRAYGQ